MRYVLKYEPKMVYCKKATFVFRIHGNNSGYYLSNDNLIKHPYEQRLTLNALLNEGNDKVWIKNEYLPNLKADVIISLLLLKATQMRFKNTNLENIKKILNVIKDVYLDQKTICRIPFRIYLKLYQKFKKHLNKTYYETWESDSQVNM